MEVEEGELSLSLKRFSSSSSSSHRRSKRRPLALALLPALLASSALRSASTRARTARASSWASGESCCLPSGEEEAGAAWRGRLGIGSSIAPLRRRRSSCRPPPSSRSSFFGLRCDALSRSLSLSLSEFVSRFSLFKLLAMSKRRCGSRGEREERDEKRSENENVEIDLTLQFRSSIRNTKPSFFQARLLTFPPCTMPALALAPRVTVAPIGSGIVV